jgi:pSer/pThr/pTyr-binding forkhead associated (FHA) protein
MAMDETVIGGGRAGGQAAGPIILVVEGPGRGSSVVLGAEPVRIGRREDCHLVLPSPTASKVHARIERREVHHTIQDLGSTNGILLNGRKLDPDSPARLAHGDSLVVGESVLLYRDEGSFQDRRGLSTIAIDVRKVREEAEAFLRGFPLQGRRP